MRLTLRTRNVLRQRRQPTSRAADSSEHRPSPTTRDTRSARSRWQFTLGDLLALMFVGAGGAVLANYLFRAVSGHNRLDRVVFALAVTVGPVGMLALVRTLSWLVSRSYRQAEPTTPPEESPGE